MKPSITPAIFLSAAVMALPLAAQTTTTPAKSSSGTTAAHSSSTVTNPCVRPAPHEPAEIPALPAGAPCPKALYTLRTTSPTHLVYASPLLSSDVHEALEGGTMTYSLDYVDMVVGTGAAVKAGEYLSVKYSGYLSVPGSKQDGNKFDSTDDHPGKQPFPIQYGMHSVIEGWDTGFEGMRVGGKRRIFIPWQLAYGERGRGPIPAKADLIFDVEVVSQSSAPPAPPARPMPPMGHPGVPGATAPQHPATVPPQGAAPGSGTTTTQPQSGTGTQPNSASQPNKPQ
jgi:peptidylprolyl isomerase